MTLSGVTCWHLLGVSVAYLDPPNTKSWKQNWNTTKDNTQWSHRCVDRFWSSIFFLDETAANLGDASSSSDMGDDDLRDSWVENFAKGAAGIPFYLCDIVILRDNALISWQILSLTPKYNYDHKYLNPPKSVGYSIYSRHFLCVLCTDPKLWICMTYSWEKMEK